MLEATLAHVVSEPIWAGDDFECNPGYAWFCPNDPWKLYPHDHRVPLVLIAYISPCPPLNLLQVVPGIWTGDEYAVLLFCPNPPLWLFPHAHNVPSVLVAKETASFLVIWFHVVPGIWTGDERFNEVLYKTLPPSLYTH